MTSNVKGVATCHLSLHPEHQPPDFDQFINNTEREYVGDVRNPRKRAFLAGRYLARKTISQTRNTAPEKIDIFIRKSGKPYAIANGQPVAVSISHDKEFAACAVSQQYELGLDLEAKIRPPIKQKSWSLIFTPREQAHLNTLKASNRAALSLFWWCIKEAAFKNSGQGAFTQLDCRDIQQISNHEVSLKGIPTSWRIISSQEIPSHYLILCISPLLSGHNYEQDPSLKFADSHCSQQQ